MRPFFKYSDYKYRIKYDYYKQLLKQSPSATYTAYIRSQFRQYQHTKKATRVRQLITKFDKQLQHPPTQLTIIGDRWYKACSLRQREHEQVYTRYLYNNQAHVKTRVTGSFIYPSYHNPPLPRLKPQPLEIHKMIRRRVLKRFEILRQLRAVSNSIHDYVMEADFYKSLHLNLDGAYIVNLFAQKDYLLARLDKESKRSQLKFSIKDLLRFRRLHQRRIEMRERSMLWRKNNHPHLIAHWRAYLIEKKKQRQREAASRRCDDGVKERRSAEEMQKQTPPTNQQHTRTRMRKHIRNSTAKDAYAGIFTKPLTEVYSSLEYNDEPAVRIAYDYSKPPQPLVSKELSKSSPLSMGKWSKTE
ncbi:hypothetical protein E3P99_01562 [Wallemia hederae]|uniref:Uncharacterized protein n=1 Tax=Wallemia hederae TaxID=1540922 RepID=A0A4T0FS06_9BASI|nr:hypothetical protein E3P99_01562 [Wallemia hederae]